MQDGARREIRKIHLGDPMRKFYGQRLVYHKAPAQSDGVHYNGGQELLFY